MNIAVILVITIESDNPVLSQLSFLLIPNIFSSSTEASIIPKEKYVAKFSLFNRNVVTKEIPATNNNKI